MIADLAGKRGHKFTLQRAVFLTVLHRQFVSGSDSAADRWRTETRDHPQSEFGRPTSLKLPADG